MEVYIYHGNFGIKENNIFDDYFHVLYHDHVGYLKYVLQ